VLTTFAFSELGKNHNSATQKKISHQHMFSLFHSITILDKKRVEPYISKSGGEKHPAVEALWGIRKARRWLTSTTRWSMHPLTSDSELNDLFSIILCSSHRWGLDRTAVARRSGQPCFWLGHGRRQRATWSTSEDILPAGPNPMDARSPSVMKRHVGCVPLRYVLVVL
jgi:hypothetical protein